jgi:hypothetical protein
MAFPSDPPEVPAADRTAGWSSASTTTSPCELPSAGGWLGECAGQAASPAPTAVLQSRMRAVPHRRATGLVAPEREDVTEAFRLTGSSDLSGVW